MKQTIITILLALVAMTGQAQVKCHVEGTLETDAWEDKGFTVVAIASERNRQAMENAAKKDGYPWPSLLELNDENQVWRKNGAGNAGGAMYLIDRDGTILSTSTDAGELEPLIRKALK